MSEETQFDPDDFEQVEEFHQELREHMAAAALDPDQARHLIEVLLGFNRHLAEALDAIAMILRRIDLDHDGNVKIADQIDRMVESIEKLTVREEVTE